VVGSGTAPLEVVLRSEGETTFENLLYLLAPHGTLTIDAQPDGTTAGNFHLTNPADSTLILVSRESTLNLSGETITNDGTFEVDGIVHVDAGTTLAGAGFVVLQAGGKLFVEGSVGTDQAVKFDDGTGLLRVAHTDQFDAEIELSADSGRFDLTDITVGSVKFTSGSSSGDFGTASTTISFNLAVAATRSRLGSATTRSRTRPRTSTASRSRISTSATRSTSPTSIRRR